MQATNASPSPDVDADTDKKHDARVATEQHAQGTSVPELDDILDAPPSTASANASGWMPPPAYLNQLAEAAKREEASFPQVFMAGMLVRDRQFGPEVNDYAERLVPRLLSGFEKRYGNTHDSRYGFTCPAGAVLLERVGAPVRNPDEPATWWSRLKRWLATRRGDILEVAVDPLDRSPRAGNLDAFVWWKLLHFDSQDATELVAEIVSLRDRITAFLPDPGPPESDARASLCAGCTRWRPKSPRGLTPRSSIGSTI